ncbi:MAG: DUF4093 domain-containing protein [Firmicutes bacterium]|nr:DUF4093 domain-containing protein [Bacillota bacterium]
MNLPKIEEIIVVEGRDDTAAIRCAVDAVTIETHGFGIREETWDLIDKAYQTKGIIVFTDPDTAGEQIRRRILERFPEAKEAFLDQALAAKAGDIGIENASPEAIQEALGKVHGSVDAKAHGTEPGTGGSGAASCGGTEPGTGGSGTEAAGSGAGTEAFTPADLFRWGLDGVPGAAQRRRQLGQKLGIGQATAKTFLHRLNRFGISREEVEAALK